MSERGFPASGSSIRSLAALAVIPSATDLALLVSLREGLGWPLLIADAVAIAVASVVSFAMHRRSALRSSPYARWVQAPLAFVLVATIAGAVDVIGLRLLFVATGFTTVTGLLAAKTLSLGFAALVRIVGYRSILSELVRRDRARGDRPLTEGSFRFSVVIPAFREPDRIGETVHAIRAEFADLTVTGDLEIIVVDDGSGDATSAAARTAGADQVIVQPRNRGKGAAVRTGMTASHGRVVAFTDADLAYDPPHLRVLLDTIEDGWDVAIGSRRHRDSQVARANGLRAIGTRIVNRMSAAVLLAAPLDTQCGLKGFRGDVARDIFTVTKVDGFAFDIEVLHVVERRGLSLYEVPVRLDETGAPSTVRVARDILRLSIDMFRIRRWSTHGDYGPAVGAPAPHD